MTTQLPFWRQIALEAEQAGRPSQGGELRLDHGRAATVGPVAASSCECRRMRDWQQEPPLPAASRDRRVKAVSDFSVFMSRTGHGTEDSNGPISDDMLHVVLDGAMLTITEASDPHQPGRRLYARRTIDLEDLTAYMVLPWQPKGKRDCHFQSALGTAILYVSHGKHRLKLTCRMSHADIAREWESEAVEVL